jgi:hypothetical protein
MSCKKNDTSVDTNCQEDNTEQQNCVLHSEENVESKSNRKSDIHNATKTVWRLADLFVNNNNLWS